MTKMRGDLDSFTMSAATHLRKDSYVAEEVGSTVSLSFEQADTSKNDARAIERKRSMEMDEQANKSGLELNTHFMSPANK